MPPKGGNSKKDAGRARKEENENKKRDAATAVKDQAEAADWDKGAKSNKAKDDREAKKAAEAARKAENARLLAEEEAAAPTKKPAPKAGAKKAPPKPKPAGPGAIAAGGPATSTSQEIQNIDEELSQTFAATGIDDALDMLEMVNAKTDKASLGTDAAKKVESHPERRFKAAFEAYLERELPEARKEHPGLRLQQYRDLLFKQFQKHPDNPFNQNNVDYNATKDEKVAALKAERARVEQRLRQ